MDRVDEGIIVCAKRLDGAGSNGVSSYDFSIYELYYVNLTPEFYLGFRDYWIGLY